MLNLETIMRASLRLPIWI